MAVLPGEDMAGGCKFVSWKFARPDTASSKALHPQPHEVVVPSACPADRQELDGSGDREVTTAHDGIVGTTAAFWGL
jgi:hypothetical protein